MKCIIHIGTEKTATTLLQEWLYDNQLELSNQSIFLSNLLGKPNNRKIVSYFQNNLDDWAKTNKIKNNYDKEIHFADFQENIYNEIEKASNDHDIYLITSEHFHSRLRTVEEIMKVKMFLCRNFDEVEVVCYFREQADMAIALYSTALKFGSDASLNSFLNHNVSPENYYFNCKAIADNWSKNFGRRSCKFRIYDWESFIDSDIRKDFLESLGISINFQNFDFSRNKSNESLSAIEGALFRKINESIPYWGEKDGGINRDNIAAKRAILTLGRVKTGIIDSHLRNDISRKFQNTNEEFFNEYFEGKYLFSERVYSPGDGGICSYDHLMKSFEELLEVLSPFCYERLSVNDKDVEYLRGIALKDEMRRNCFV